MRRERMADGKKYLIGIIDDDTAYLEGTKYFLEKSDYVVLTFDSGDEFIKKLEADREFAENLDLIVLDILMPGMSGFEVLQKIRKNSELSRLKVIMRSSENSDENRIRYIKEGADDFISKTDSIGELLARIEARLRDSRRDLVQTNQADEKLPPKPYPFTVNLDEDYILIDGTRVDFTDTEYRILALLIRDMGKYVNKPFLEEIVSGWRPGAMSRALDAHISRIRRKITNANPNYSNVLSAKKGFGIMLHVDGVKNAK